MTTTSEAPAVPDRTARSSPGARSPRGRRGTTATIVALLVVLVCAAAAVEAISLAMHRTTVAFHVSDVARYGRDTYLEDTVVLVVAIVAFVIGVLLVVAALVPPRRRLVDLAEPDRTIAAGLTRRSFRRTLAAAALTVDGVTNARVSGRRRLKVKAVTSLRHTETLPDRVRERVEARLAELNPAKKRTVRVRLDRKDD